MHNIVSYLFKRPLLVRLIMIFIIFLSVISFTQIKRLSYPLVDLAQMDITTVYPGASPEDVETNVTIKVEEELKRTIGIKKYTSKSVENMSSVHIWLDEEATDMDQVKSDIRTAVTGITDFPDEVDSKPSIVDWKMENDSVFGIAVASDTLSDSDIAYHTKAIKKKLLNLPSTSFITESGMPEREIQVLLNMDKMNEYYISFDEVINAIKNNNLRLSGGSLESYTQQKGIVTFSEFSDPHDIENIIIRAGDAASDIAIRIKDIGTVVDGFEKKDALFRFNGKRGASLFMGKKANADIITYVDKEVMPLLDEYKEQYAPEGLYTYVLYDGSVETKSRLKVVYSNALAGFALVVLILFFFLDKKVALWTSAGIPISVGLTLIVLPRLGITINSISLCGLVVVLGMVVDDAIIVAESIYSAKEAGANGLEAATFGLKKVIRPVFGTIVTTMIAFSPLYFIPGMIGDFSIEIPSIVIIMLAASFFEATTILPVHLAHDFKETDKEKSTTPPGLRLIRALEQKYRRILKTALSHRIKTIAIIFVLLLGLGGLSAKLIKFNMFPIDQSFRIWIIGNTVSGSSLQFTSDEILKVEKLLQKIPEEGIVKSYDSFVGRDYYEDIVAANAFTFRIILTPASERKMTAADVRDFLKEEIDKTDLGSIETIQFYIEGGGPPSGNPLELSIIGNDNEKRKALTKKITDDLSSMGVTDIESNVRSEKEELRLVPDYEAIAKAQLSVAQISSVIRTAIDGSIVSYMNTPDRRVPFRVMLDEESKDFSAPLKGLFVRNNLGRLVAVTELVHQKKDKAVQNIYHYNGDRQNTITGNIDLESTTPKEVYAALNEKYKNFERENPGYQLIIGGEAEENSRVYQQMMIATGVALLLIYFILVLQFNSVFQPGMVILAVPFGLVGILLAFTIQGMELSMMALIGVLGFTGVVVNDSLIMVDFINSLLRTKKDHSSDELRAGIIDGAAARFRPILLTTVTTVAGLLPTAYGLIGGFDDFISPMVMAMMWGLVVGTLSTLMAIPVFYLVIHDFGKLFQRKQR